MGDASSEFRENWLALVAEARAKIATPRDRRYKVIRIYPEVILRIHAELLGLHDRIATLNKNHGVDDDDDDLAWEKVT